MKHIAKMDKELSLPKPKQSHSILKDLFFLSIPFLPLPFFLPSFHFSFSPLCSLRHFNAQALSSLLVLTEVEDQGTPGGHGMK